MDRADEQSREKRPYRAVVAGFCASAASGLVLLFTHIVAKIFLHGLGPVAFLDALLQNGLTELAGANFYLAIGLHFVVGITLALIYVKIRERLPEKTWEAAFVFMTIPFLFSVFVLFPLTGGGLFGLAYGAGLLPGLGSLILHAVYGVTMVGLYEKMGGFSQNFTTSATGERSRRVSMRYASIGILLGSAIGVTLVACLSFLVEDNLKVTGLPSDFTFMSLIFFCSAVGLLVGFWTGVPDREAT